MQWTVDQVNRPGPIQLKRVNEGLRSLVAEHNVKRRLTGVVGGDEFEASVSSIFGTNVREDVKGAQEKLFKQFNGIVSRANASAVADAIVAELAILIKNRPLEDERISAEEHAARAAKAQAEYARSQADLEARRNQKEATGTYGTVKLNHYQDGVEVHFPAKPASDVISRLKSNGFRWSRHSHCWYKKKSDYAIRIAYEIAGAKLPTAETMGVAPIEGVGRTCPSASGTAQAGTEFKNAPVQTGDTFDMHVEDQMAEACGLK